MCIWKNIYIYTYANLQKRLLSDINLKPYIWWRYIDDIFLIWEDGEESLNCSQKR